jgi:subtilisin family serine protease
MRVLLAALVAGASAKLLKGNGELIENEWIVKLRPNATKAERASHIALLGEAEVFMTYDHVFTGYAVKAPEHVMERYSNHPDVEYVEQNQVVRALQTCQPGSANPPAGLWGLSRVSFRTIRTPIQPVQYSSTKGADIYILDTGINYGHNDFAPNRARFGQEFNQVPEGPGDGNGHGTHCAGTAGGVLHGISKQADIIDVKVLNRSGSGSFAGVAGGIDWVGSRPGGNNRVASLSLGGGFSQIANDAVTRLASNTFALASIASGNGNANACNTSPASAPGSITVNAITTGDTRSTFSNWGTCTHIFAPGQNVLSAWIGSNTATNTISGTSMACPHVTGIISDMWGRRPGSDGNAIRANLYAIAVEGTIINPGVGSPNRLAVSDCAV